MNISSYYITFASEMSRTPNNTLFIDHIPRIEGSVPHKTIIRTIYTMAYVEDISKLFIKIDRSTISLALYLSDEHGDNKQFSYNKLFVHTFNEYLKENMVEPYHRMTLDRSMKQLRDYGFVLKIGRGVYVVSPKFYYRGEPHLRVGLIQQLYRQAMDYEPVDIKAHNEVTK